MSSIQSGALKKPAFPGAASVGRSAEPVAVRLASLRPPACWATPQRPSAESNTYPFQLITWPSLSLDSNQMCVPLKRQVAHYTTRLLIWLHLSPAQHRALSVWMPPAVFWRQRGACAIHPHHLLNRPRTSARRRRLTASRGICELWHQLQPPSVRVFVCISPMSVSPPCASVREKCVCGPWDMTRTVLLTVLLLICSQHSGGGLGPAEEELGRRGRGSPEVLLQGNLSDPTSRRHHHHHHHPAPDWCPFRVMLKHVSWRLCAGTMFDSWSAFEVGTYFAFRSQRIDLDEMPTNAHTNRVEWELRWRCVWATQTHWEISKIFFIFWFIMLYNVRWWRKLSVVFTQSCWIEKGKCVDDQAYQRRQLLYMQSWVSKDWIQWLLS